MSGGLSPDRELVRNLSQVRGKWTVLHEGGPFRVIEFEKRIEGSLRWVVSEKGFLWEAVDDLSDGLRYLTSDEALRDRPDAPTD